MVAPCLIGGQALHTEHAATATAAPPGICTVTTACESSGSSGCRQDTQTQGAVFSGRNGPASLTCSRRCHSCLAGERRGVGVGWGRQQGNVHSRLFPRTPLDGRRLREQVKVWELPASQARGRGAAAAAQQGCIAGGGRGRGRGGALEASQKETLETDGGTNGPRCPLV